MLPKLEESAKLDLNRSKVKIEGFRRAFSLKEDHKTSKSVKNKSKSLLSFIEFKGDIKDLHPKLEVHKYVNLQSNFNHFRLGIDEEVNLNNTYDHRNLIKISQKSPYRKNSPMYTKFRFLSEKMMRKRQTPNDKKKEGNLNLANLRPVNISIQ